MARPSKYSDEVLDRVCEALGRGVPLTRICEADDMPADRTVNDWENEKGPDGELTERAIKVSAAIARARARGFDVIALEGLDILDAEPVMIATQYGEKVDPGDVALRKARFEGRMKLLAKWDPRRYGDKVQHADANGEVLPPAPQFIVQGVPAPERGDD